MQERKKRKERNTAIDLQQSVKDNPEQTFAAICKYSTSSGQEREYNTLFRAGIAEKSVSFQQHAELREISCSYPFCTSWDFNRYFPKITAGNKVSCEKSIFLFSLS